MSLYTFSLKYLLLFIFIKILYIYAQENVTWYAYKDAKHVTKSALRRSWYHGGQNHLGYVGSRNNFKTSHNKDTIKEVLMELNKSPLSYLNSDNGKAYPYRTYQERKYFYGHIFYDFPEQETEIECFFELNGDSKDNWNIYDNVNNLTIEELVFHCPKSQTCCDIQCCQGWSLWKTVLLMLSVGIVCFSCCYCCTFQTIQKFARNRKKEKDANNIDGTMEIQTFVAPNFYQNENVYDSFKV